MRSRYSELVKVLGDCIAKFDANSLVSLVFLHLLDKVRNVFILICDRASEEEIEKAMLACLEEPTIINAHMESILTTAEELKKLLVEYNKYYSMMFGDALEGKEHETTTREQSSD